MKEVDSLEAIQEAVSTQLGLLLYFSTPSCNVCKALKPKISDAFKSRYPKIEQYSVDAAASPEIAAHFQVFSVPTILVFLEGKEFARASRNLSVSRFVEQIARPYRILST